MSKLSPPEASCVPHGLAWSRHPGRRVLHCLLKFLGFVVILALEEANYYSQLARSRLYSSGSQTWVHSWTSAVDSGLWPRGVHSSRHSWGLPLGPWVAHLSTQTDITLCLSTRQVVTPRSKAAHSLRGLLQLCWTVTLPLDAITQPPNTCERQCLHFDFCTK